MVYASLYKDEVSALTVLSESESLTLESTSPKHGIAREPGADFVNSPATITAPVGHTIGNGQVDSPSQTMDIDANINSLIWFIWDESTNWQVVYGGAPDFTNNIIARPDSVALGNLGTTETLTASTTTAQVFTGIANANLTLTIAGFSIGAFVQPVQLILDYDGIAQRTLTFSGVDWWDGPIPANGPDIGERLVLTFTDIGDGEVVGTLIELEAA